MTFLEAGKGAYDKSREKWARREKSSLGMKMRTGSRREKQGLEEHLELEGTTK